MRISSLLRALCAHVSFTCLLALCVHAASARAQDEMPSAPSYPSELMQLAARTNGFLGNDLRPWRLKVSYSAFDSKGNLQDQGVIEQFWVSRNKQKTIYTNSKSSFTTYVTATDVYMTGGLWNNLVAQAYDQLITPIAGQLGRKFGLQNLDTGGIQTNCFRQQYADGSFFGATWCIDPGTTAVRLRVQEKGPNILYSNPIVFQGRYLAGDVKLSYGDLNNIESGNGNVVIHLDTVELLTKIDNADFVPPPNATAGDGAATANVSKSSAGEDSQDYGGERAALAVPLPKMANVSGGVMQAMLLHKVSPEYPPEAKQAGVSGTVVLQATIGLDGRVEELHVVSGKPVLHQAALDAVKQWLYKPYLLNGNPVKVKTTINVVFLLDE